MSEFCADEPELADGHAIRVVIAYREGGNIEAIGIGDPRHTHLETRRCRGIAALRHGFAAWRRIVAIGRFAEFCRCIVVFCDGFAAWRRIVAIGRFAEFAEGIAAQIEWRIECESIDGRCMVEANVDGIIIELNRRRIARCNGEPLFYGVDIDGIIFVDGFDVAVETGDFGELFRGPRNGQIAADGDVSIHRRLDELIDPSAVGAIAFEVDFGVDALNFDERCIEIAHEHAQ